MTHLCHECDADEFNRVGDDWVCSNGHVQTWTVISQPKMSAQ
jgi:hypothetical protein